MDTIDELPPLPQKKNLANPYAHNFGSVTAYGYDDKQMQDYARKAVKAAFEVETEQSIKADCYDMIAEAIEGAGYHPSSIVDFICALMKGEVAAVGPTPSQFNRFWVAHDYAEGTPWERFQTAYNAMAKETE